MVIEFADRDISEAYPLVQAAYRRFHHLRGSHGIVTVVPGYTSVTVFYDPMTAHQLHMTEYLRREVNGLTPYVQEAARTVEIPVCYGGEYGPDLAEVADYASLTEDEVISIHSSQRYTVYMIGFAPGFPYLGGMDERIAMPRRSTPRVNIPAGSVGVAGAQTGVYPNDSPGGWQLIGRTPIRLFDPLAAQPSVLQSGDEVRFRPISDAEYLNLKVMESPEGSRDVRVEGPSAGPRDGSGDVRVEGPSECSQNPPASPSTIEVIKPGLLTTVQDQGRYGYEHLGVSPGGAMDPMSAAMANTILGNDEDAAVLEMTWIGPVLEFNTESWIALCGADMEAKVDGIYLPTNRLIRVAKGAVLSFGRAKQGARTYLAVAGGIQVPNVLGSRSTHVHGKLGGYEGRPLRAGDLLQSGSPAWIANVESKLRTVSMQQTSTHAWVSRWQVRWTSWQTRWTSHSAEAFSVAGGSRFTDHGTSADDSRVVTVRVIKGPEADWFSEGDLVDFTDRPYQISQDSNRMGYRLAGTPISRTHSRHLWSSAVSFGTVQVPPSGQPVILMAERQTTGGYPRIGVVATVDRPLLAQLRPGHQVRFHWIDAETAQKLLREQQEVAKQVKTAVRLMGGRL